MLKSIIILLLILPILIFAQHESYNIERACSTFKYEFSDNVNTVLAGDSLTIAGVDTVWIFIHSGKSLGMMHIHGTVEAISGADTVYFELGVHNGNGSARDANQPETYFAMDTVMTSATGAYNFHPLDEAVALKTKAAIYYTYKIYHTTTKTVVIKGVIDLISAYIR